MVTKNFVSHLNNMENRNQTLALLKSTNTTHGLESPLAAVQTYTKLVQNRDEDVWRREGNKKTLELFHAAAKNIPAYKAFLKEHKVDSKNIKTIRDFAEVPETTKSNYIEKYSLEERSWNGVLDNQSLIATSSGATGEPTLWARNASQEIEATLTHNLLFTQLYEIEKLKTVAIIGFPMGAYVSGIATTIPSWLLTLKHPNLTIITVGNNKRQVLGLIKKMQKKYDQTLLIGHPFFIKDVLESGKDRGIQWGRSRVRAMFCSEGFTESWRTYVGNLIRTKTPERDVFSTYGSTELLLMGYENPFTILIRQIAEANPAFCEKVFGTNMLPQLFHYNPLLRHIETSKDGELLYSMQGGAPLIRYNLQDEGSIFSCKQIKKALSEQCPEWKKQLESIGWKQEWNLPLVALHGRSNNTIVFYAANIYPEHIHRALNAKSLLNSLTGKFVMKKSYIRKMDQKLTIHVELQEGVRISKVLQRNITKRVVQTLEKVNMEYLFLRENLDKDLVPEIILHKYQDEKYFPVGLKPKYILR